MSYDWLILPHSSCVVPEIAVALREAAFSCLLPHFHHHRDPTSIQFTGLTTHTHTHTYRPPSHTHTHTTEHTLPDTQHTHTHTLTDTQPTHTHTLTDTHPTHTHT